jgi:dipeptidyl aminopeptidase/acylaminoacyl peptidase
VKTTKLFIFFIVILTLFGCKSKVRRVPVVSQASSDSYIYFLSQRDSIQSVYRLNLVDHKIEKVLPDSFGAVYELKFSPSGDVAIFKTAEFEGTVGAGFHLIKNPKIYLFDVSTGEVAMLKVFDDSWSVKIRWLNSDTVEVYRISGGYQTGENFKLEVYGFAPDGELLYAKNREYDWRKGEFPEDFPDVKLSSSDGRYSVEIKEDSIIGVRKIYLVGRDSRFEIFETRWKISQLDWSSDGTYLVFSVVNITPEAVEVPNVKTGEIYYFDISKRNLYKISSGSGLFNFRFINGTQIIFDKGFEDKSEIYLYDLYQQNMKRLTNDDYPDGVSSIPKILGFSA